MKSWRAVILVALVAATALTLAPAALAWRQNRAPGSEGLTTQQWILAKAVELAAGEGVDWVDVSAALPVVDDPDTRLHDFRYHVYDRWGRKHGAAQLRTSMYFELVRAALERGDTPAASRFLGLLAHYYSDACNPLHTDTSRGERRRVHRAFERPVAGLLSSSQPNRVQRKAANARVRDVGDDIAAFTVLSAREAHRDYRRAVRTVRRHGFSKKAARLAGRAVKRAVEGVAGMIVAANTDGGVVPLSARPAPQQSPAILSLHKSTAVSSEDGLYHPAPFANDGDRGSWWTADTAEYPQWWQVDLGERPEIGSVKIDWFKGKTRSYTYTIDVSDDGKSWWTAVDRGARTGFGTSTDMLLGERGRYVRVTVLGYVPSRKTASDRYGPAAITECTVYATSAVIPTPTPTPTPTPSSSAKPSPTPAPTPSSSAKPSPTPTPTPSPPPSDGAIMVSGTSAAAVDAAFAKAARGDTVHFPAGTYTHGTLDVPDGVDVTGAGISRTHLQFGITFGSDSQIGGTAAQGLLVGNAGSIALRNRDNVKNTSFSFVRFRGGGPRAGVDYSKYTDSSSNYTSYDPVVQLGGKGTKRSASRITFTDCEFERSVGSYVSTRVRANIMSLWEDNRSGYAHLEYLSFMRCHWGVKNVAGQYGATTANIEFKTNSQSSEPDFSHNWHDVVLRDCIFERSGEFNLDFTDSARDWLKSNGMTESGTTGGVPNWTLVPLRYHAGTETGRSVSVIGGQIKGAGYYYEGWRYVFCLENPIGAALRGVTIWGGARTNPEPESTSDACGPILASALPDWSRPLTYDLRGMVAVYDNTYYPGVWGSYTASPYDP